MINLSPRVALPAIALLLAACAAGPSPTDRPSADATGSAAPSAAASTAPATLAPTLAPTSAPTSTPTAPPTEPPVGPGPSLPPVFGSPTLTTDLDAAPNSDIGGCGSLWVGSEVYGSDQCGPHAFALDAAPVVVAPGGTMTFAAPDGYLFSVDRLASSPEAAGIHAWSVAIAPVAALQNLAQGDQETISGQHGGRILGYGDRAVISAWVKAPSVPGEYLVELDAAINLGDWTWTWPEFFWRVSVR